MNDKTNNFFRSRIFIALLILAFICITALIGTYAWFTWTSTDNTELTMTIGKLADVTFTYGNDISTSLVPVFSYTDGEKTTFSVNNRNTSGESFAYVVKLNITTIPTELRSNSVKYTLVKDGVVVANDNLSNASNGSSIEVYSTELTSGITSYEFYLYIDSNIENSTSMQNKTLVGNIMVEQV